MKSTKRVSLITSSDGSNYLLPFILVTSLFLLWGVAHSILDILNKHFQNVLALNRAQSGFVQFALFMGYFIMAVPGGLFIKRFGYKSGIIFGLTLFALGAFLFYPAAAYGRFFPFLLALFILGSGSAILETAANPYSSALGPKETGPQRINFSQSFNGLGQILGPLMGGLLVFGAQKRAGDGKFDSLLTPYMLIGVVVSLVALAFLVTPMPNIQEGNEEEGEENPPMKELLKHPFFIMAVLAQFLYVAAQTGVNSFFINYSIEEVKDIFTPVKAAMAHLGYFGEVFMPNNPEQASSLLLAFGGLTLFWIGRIIGTYLMKFFSPSKLLMIYALINTVLIFLVVLTLGTVSIIALFGCYFFMSIMFPTIFALGIRDLGALTKKGASFIVMAVVGAALCPPIMGAIADCYGMAIGFLIPMICFAYIFFFALIGVKKERIPQSLEAIADKKGAL
ncbi:MAG: L-fucose:H+ symporter permease [Verrucomicrobia bacterium]|nr:L-fucose:H+ symporter permease [Verrucomicrobiota bacterium]